MLQDIFLTEILPPVKGQGVHGEPVTQVKVTWSHLLKRQLRSCCACLYVPACVMPLIGPPLMRMQPVVFSKNISTGCKCSKVKAFCKGCDADDRGRLTLIIIRNQNYKVIMYDLLGVFTSFDSVPQWVWYIFHKGCEEMRNTQIFNHIRQEDSAQCVNMMIKHFHL